MSQNAVARPDMRFAEFPVHHSREAGFDESPDVVILSSRGWWTIDRFLRTLGKRASKRLLPSVLAMHDPKATHERHARVVLQPLSDALQDQALVEPVESLADGDKVHGTRHHRKILGPGMDPFDIGDAPAASQASALVQHLRFDVHRDDFPHRWCQGQRKPPWDGGQVQDKRVVSQVCIGLEASHQTRRIGHAVPAVECSRRFE